MLKRVLVEHKEDGCWVMGRYDSSLCWGGLVDVLSELFKLPWNIKEVTKLWLSLHERPAANRARVKVVRPFGWVSGDDDVWDLELAEELEGVSRWREGEDAFDKILRPFAGRTLYLQVEYEEP